MSITKLSKAFLFISIVICIAITFSGCEFEELLNEFKADDEIYATYQNYVEYTEDAGDKPLSYEEWLESIRGKDGKTPSISIDEEGYWVIDGIRTEVKARGENGADGTEITIGDGGHWVINGETTEVKAEGVDGKTPTITINEDGYWVINGEVTEVKAEGVDGKTPTITINEEGYWVINGETTEVKAEGVDGKTPTITINEDGYWVINGETTEVKAEGVDGKTPTITINEDGYWVINGEVTEVKAEGTDGVTPTISINEDGYWVINGETTEVKAEGVDGVTPTVSINEDGYWVINGETTEVKAEGVDGVTPTITINEDGYWVINGEVTEVKAEGVDGKTPTITINEEGYWVINGETTEVKAEGVDGKTPTITINEDGYWVINGEVTEVKAEGVDGKTPTITINEEGYWVINGETTEVKAEGVDGKTPTITINEDGYWVINGEVTEVKAEGTDGVTPTITINQDGYWVINGETTEVKAEGADGVGIDSAEINDDGHLILNLTNGESIDCGVVVLKETEHVHTWNDWIVFLPNTCYDAGWKARDCAECFETEIRILHPSHELVYHDAKAPTCTLIGWSAYEECTKCDYSTFVAIPELSHNFEWIETSKATCESSGERVYKCKNCEIITDDEAIEATGHSFSNDVCVHCGLRRYYVNVSYVYSDNSIASPSVVQEVIGNRVYSIASPEISGYKADIPVISGKADGEESHIYYTVRYNILEAVPIVSIDNVDLGNVVYNTQFSALSLPDTVTAHTQTGEVLNLIVSWNSSSYNPTVYGDQTVTGTVYSAYGYIMSCDPLVEASLTVVGNVIKEIPTMGLGKLPVGTSYDGLGLPSTVAVKTEDGSTYYIPVEWNLYNYDSLIVGQHSINGTLTLGEGFVLADEVENVATVTFELSERMYGTADIVFIVDTTGSMYGEIQNVRNNIITFANHLEEAGVSVRWALLEYRDITCDGASSTKVIYCGSSEWYIDVCTSLESITIPSSVTSIGYSAFYYCTSLKTVTFAEGSKLTLIGNSAFRNCTSLTSITIPSSVTSIGTYAFSYCTSLTSVTFENKSGWWYSSSSSATSGTSISATDLESTSTAATYLTSTYVDMYWRRIVTE